MTKGGDNDKKWKDDFVELGGEYRDARDQNEVVSVCVSSSLFYAMRRSWDESFKENRE